MLPVLHEAYLERIEELKKVPSADPINLFVKPEPHKISKRDSGAWRLIFGVSVVDQLVAHSLFHGVLKNQSETWGLQPNMIGWNPIRGGASWLYRALQADRCVVQSTDKSSWDWTLQPHVVRIVRKVIADWFPMQSMEVLSIVDNHVLSMLGPKRLQNSGGLELETQVTGVMPSGWLMTIVINGVCQYVLHTLALQYSGEVKTLSDFTRFSDFFAMGDDTVQAEMSAAYWSCLPFAGCIVKETETILPGAAINFCGVSILHDKVVPSYRDKHAFVLHYLDDSEVALQLLQCYQIMYAYVPGALNRLNKCLVEMGRKDLVRSVGLMQTWFRWSESVC